MPDLSPGVLKSPTEPNLPAIGFTLSPEQRAAFAVEKTKAFAAANDPMAPDSARQAAQEYNDLKTEELNSNAVASAPVKDDSAVKSPTDNECSIGTLIVAAARLDLGVLETGTPPGLNYGGIRGGGQLPPGVPGRIDQMDSVCGIDNQAEVKRTGQGVYWCASAVATWWKSVGLALPPVPSSCKSWESWGRSNGLFSNTPKIGAAILYGTSGSAHHIGIVSSVAEDGTITTIEGNTTGGDFNKNGCGVFSKTPRAYIGFIIPPPCAVVA